MRIEQDSQRATGNGTLSKKKKKKHKIVAESSKTGKDPNSVSFSDVETESGNASDKEEVEEEPENLAKNAKYMSWEFRDSSHGEAYRRGSTVVMMGPARDCANGDTSVYPGSGPSRMKVKPLLPTCFILS
jgi:hypothetical protein